MKYLLNKKFLIVLSSLFLLLVIVFVILFLKVSFNLPDVSKLKEFAPPITSKIYASGGEVLLEIGKEKRELVKIEEIPKVVIDAFLSSEDSNFYNHSGVDLLGIARAMIANIKAGKVVQGGSTITQQVVKSLLLSRERKLERKIKEAILARRLEDKFSKDEILFMYLNQVYLGGGYYGLKAASKGYFNKTLKDITVAEAALMAGLLVAPGRYSPYLNPLRAKKRQNYVLSRMYHNKKINKDEYDKALHEDIKLSRKSRAKLKAPYFTEWIRQRVVSLVGEERFLTEGFEVKTTLDLKLQEQAERAAKTGVRKIDKRQGYKGAIEKVAYENFQKKIIKMRQELLTKITKYSYLTEKGKLVNELDYQREDNSDGVGKVVKSLLELDELFIKDFNFGFAVGNNQEDLKVALNYLAEEKDYPALVLELNKKRNLALVDIGGIRGLIKLENYRWAEKRVLSEELVHKRGVTRVSQVFKKGDLVYVRLVDKKMYPANQVFSLPQESYAYKQSYLNFKLEQKPEVQTAIATVDEKTGAVLALVGGSDFAISQFNRAVQSKRQPGSAFKPFIYASALENGFTPSSVLLDTPQALNGVDKEVDWKPRNYDGKFKGFLTLRKSLEESRNVPTITLLRKMGLHKLEKFLKRLGLNLSREIDLSIALGSFGFSLLDMTRLYSLFPNGGKAIQPKTITSITARDGEDLTLKEQEELAKKNDKVNKNVIVDGRLNFQSGLSGTQILDPKLSFIMTQMLKGVIDNGTGRKASYVHPEIGGKTGTTNSYIDAWFIGFSSNMVTGVWTGFDDNKTLGHGESGAKAAMPIWSDYMQKAVKLRKPGKFISPSGVIAVKINRRTGKIAQAEKPEETSTEYFVKGTEPGGLYSEERKFDEMGIIDDEDYYSSQDE